MNRKPRSRRRTSQLAPREQAQGEKAKTGGYAVAMRRPKDRERSPRAVQSLHPRPDYTSSARLHVRVRGRTPRRPVGALQGCSDRLTRGSTGSVWNPRWGGWLPVAVRSACLPSERASTYAEARVLQFGFWHTAHTARHRPTRLSVEPAWVEHVRDGVDHTRN